jgi:hypothetical protein
VRCASVLILGADQFGAGACMIGWRACHSFSTNPPRSRAPTTSDPTARESPHPAMLPGPFRATYAASRLARRRRTTRRMAIVTATAATAATTKAVV